jgi:para-aminobenzoate synthetase component 1
MIVDLLRNDLGKNCRYGSVTVPELFTIESYPNVHHLVSTIRGEIAEGKDVFDVLIDAFPGGSITGAPKLRSMQIIDEVEASQRGIYCGSLLYIDTRGEMDSSIAIRTLLAKDGFLTCWGGGGIIADSGAGSEYQESLTKVRNLMDCLEQHFLSEIGKTAVTD